MNYSPANPTWSNRDRFVLSNGHACALQYCMLHLAGKQSVGPLSTNKSLEGYKVTMDDLRSFRQVITSIGVSVVCSYHC